MYRSLRVLDHLCNRTSFLEIRRPPTCRVLVKLKLQTQRWDWRHAVVLGKLRRCRSVGHPAKGRRVVICFGRISCFVGSRVHYYQTTQSMPEFLEPDSSNISKISQCDRRPGFAIWPLFQQRIRSSTRSEERFSSK